MNAAAQAWLLLQHPEGEAFARACHGAQEAQAAILAGYLSAAVSTEFGREHGFGAITSYEEFQRAVPLRTYGEIEPWIARAAGGNAGVLTPGIPECVEETSGSTGFSKVIPYTQALRREFERAVAAWMIALNRDYPGAFAGHCYWSLSPPLKPRRKTTKGAPIGMGNDVDYFSPEAARLIGGMMAVAIDPAKARSADAFYLETLAQLLACEDLSFISVWSPTFFLQLDRQLRENSARVVQRVRTNGIATQPRIREIIARLGRDFTWQDLWPQLAVLSCWTHAQSAPWAQEAALRSGNTCTLQAKGLMSTEGVVTIPLRRDADPVLAIRSHFYEFLALDGSCACLPAQVRIGHDYEVVLTTGGGLYRYRTGDVVRVTGFYSPGVPHLRFIGRAGRCSDLVGEKICEYQVVLAIEAAIQASSMSPKVAFLHPCAGPGYCLRIASSADADVLRGFVEVVERVLFQNPYYAQAVKLGQLTRIRYERISEETVLRMCRLLRMQQNIRDGSFKFPALWTADEVGPAFTGVPCHAIASK